MNNTNSLNQLPERKGHLPKLSTEQLEAITAHQRTRWSAYANMYKAVELSYQAELDAARKQQPQVIQNVAGVAIANEAIQKTSPYTETPQPVQNSAPLSFESNPLLQTGTPNGPTPEVEDPVAAAEKVVQQAYDAMQGVQ